MVLYDYQKETMNKALKYFKNKTPPIQFNIFFEMGLGKTLTSIHILNNMVETEDIKKILIVCPKSLITMWEHELNRHAIFQYVNFNIPEYFLNFESANSVAIMITNYEQFLNNKKLFEVDFVILDEVHKVKNPYSKTHRTMKKYITSKYRLNLTGTPITNTLLDIFGIHTVMDEITCNNYLATSFKKRYVDNGGNLTKQQLMNHLKPFTVFADLEKYIDMPGYEHREIYLPLSQKESTQLECIYTEPQPALARLIKAQTFLSNTKHKQNILDDLLNTIFEENKKAVIFCKFDKEYDYLMTEYKDICVGINGKVKDRDVPVYEFQNNDNIKLFIGNLQTAGFGITLTAANYCIFYSQTLDWKDFEQACARIYRIGQKQACIYYHILYQYSVDSWAYLANQHKGDVIQQFKNLYGEELECQRM